MTFKPDKEDTFEGTIVSLGEYRPWTWHKEQGGNGRDYPEHSGRILDLKSKKAGSTDYFFDYLVANVKKNKPTAIAVVPSHDASKGPTSGVHNLAARLAKEFGISDGRTCLVRYTTIPKLAGGGDRSIDVHLNSIRVENPDRIKGHSVWLIDDVKTSGNSLLACRRLLLKAGAKEVKMISLGRTTH
jgi:predicted amidophosphoribosyltransferase